MSDYSNLNLGRPLNEASHTTIPGDHSSGLGGHSSSGLGGSAPLNAGTAAPGDYKSSGADQGFARDVLNTLDNRTSHAGTGAGFGGQQHGQQTVSGQYETTNPASGIQRSGESEPHGLRSGGHAHANFPAESDTLTSGEAGQFGSENDARRQEGLVGAATGHHHQSSHQHASGLTGGHTGPSSREMDQELNDPKRGLPDLVGHPVSSGYGLNKGHRGDESSHSHSGAGLAGAGALGGAGALAGAGLAHGHHSDPTVGHGGASGLQGGARPAHDSILNTNEKPKELEIGGFNPKGAALDVDPTVHEPKEVERISSGSGPHALVWDEASNKYVHRRELEGNTLREPTRQ